MLSGLLFVETTFFFLNQPKSFIHNRDPYNIWLNQTMMMKKSIFPHLHRGNNRTVSSPHCCSLFQKFHTSSSSLSKGRHVTVETHYPLKSIQIGDYATLTTHFTQEDVIEFARIVGDFNPAHFDDQFVQENMNGLFKGKVIHGILVGGLISRLAGTILPGPGSVYLHQTFNFVKPAYVYDPLKATVTCVKSLNKKGNVFLFDTVVENEDTGEVLIQGEAKVYHPTVRIAEQQQGEKNGNT